MSFTVLHKEDTKIDTAKGHEHVEVQVVQISRRDGAVENRVEARVFIEGNVDGYNGPTKAALVFSDKSQVDALIATLAKASDYLDRLVPGVAAAVPMKAEVAPKVAKRQPAKAAPKRRVAA